MTGPGPTRPVLVNNGRLNESLDAPAGRLRARRTALAAGWLFQTQS